KEERELEYQTTRVPKCSFCLQQHWRCKEKKYTNSFNEISENISYICGQFEVTGFVHSKCQCDYFDLSLICEYCDTNCIRSYARWGDGYLSSDIIGLFEFGTYRFLEGSDNNNTSEDINEL
ncbi:13899_t:CDS:2, partial [Racocetra persica]